MSVNEPDPRLIFAGMVLASRHRQWRAVGVPVPDGLVREVKAQPIPLHIRREVAERSGGLCELGCGRRAVHTHHRKLRSQGGRHEPANLLHLCLTHHDEAHANPERAYALGWLVRASFDPADVPVVTAVVA